MTPCKRACTMALLVAPLIISLGLGCSHRGDAAKYHALAREATDLAQADRHAEALSKAQEALAIQERVLGVEHPQVVANRTIVKVAEAHVLEVEVVQLYKEKRFTEAIPKAQDVLRIYEEAFGKNDLRLAPVLTFLGDLHHAIGQAVRARSQFEQALNVQEQTLGPEHLDVAKSLKRIAGLLCDTDRCREARPFYERALRIEEQALALDHPQVADTLVPLSAALLEDGAHIDALQHAERAQAILRASQGDRHPGLVTSLGAVGRAQMRLGDHVGARRSLEEALTLSEELYGNSHIEVARALGSLAELEWKTGNPSSAWTLYERTLRIQSQALGLIHPDVASTTDALGLLSFDRGNHGRAKVYFEVALAIRTKALGRDHPVIATSLNNLALAVGRLGDTQRQKTLLEKSLDILDKAYGDHPTTAQVLHNLGALNAQLGDIRNARPLIERAIRIRRTFFGETSVDYANSLTSLATLHWKEGSYQEAEAIYKRALAVKEGFLGMDHPALREELRSLALLYWITARAAEAVPLLRRADSVSRAYLNSAMTGMGHREKMILMDAMKDDADLALSLPADTIPGDVAYRMVETRRNLLFRVAVTERIASTAASAPDAAKLLQEYRETAHALSSAYLAFAGEEEYAGKRKKLITLSVRMEDIQANLARASGVGRGEDGTEISVERTCRELPRDSALVVFALFGRWALSGDPREPPSSASHYMAFVFRGGECSNLIRIDLGPAAPIDELVARFREAVGKEGGRPEAQRLRAEYRQRVATRLGDKLFLPALRQAIAGKPRVIIAPDGALALVPFALLPGEDGHEFLLETRALSYVASAGDLFQSSKRTTADTELMAIGAPTFGQVPAQSAQATSGLDGCGMPDEAFAPLPGTAAELQAITAAYQKTHPTQSATVLEGTKAAKVAFLEYAPTARILHLATHAYFAGEDCGKGDPSVGSNLLLLTGIALAGANERAQAEGVLTALEITALDLRSTDLVVLSACDTGLGTLARGQELLGLRWAFAYAGAKNTVTSLWTVPDAETATLMGHFYTALWEGRLSIADALRAAQLKMLQADRDQGGSAPHAWGAFVVSGRP